jgi:superfamily II DNA/RNA helicase
MTQLQLCESSLNGEVSQIQKRDCFIVFSRRDIFKVKNFIEVNTGLKCAVIYGGLPPESRKEQADLFNDETSGYDVLVATDAVGMGLNLNIKRIVFFKVKKTAFVNGYPVLRSVEHTLMKQIAGRAGRRGFYDVGFVTTFYQKDFEYLKVSIGQKLKSIDSAGIFPTLEQLEEFSVKFPDQGKDMASILEKYMILSRVHSDFFLCDYDAVLNIAKRLRYLNLNLSQQYTFMNAPVPNDENAVNQIVQYAEDFANPSVPVVPLHIDVKRIVKGMEDAHTENDQKSTEQLVQRMSGNSSNPSDIKDQGSKYNEALRNIESAIKILDAYRWLALRYPVRFDLMKVNAALDKLIEQISTTLIHHTRENQKSRHIMSLPQAPPIQSENNSGSPHTDIFSTMLSNV